MSFQITLVRWLSGTVLGREVKAYFIRIGKRRLALRFTRLAEHDFTLAVRRGVLDVVAAMIKRARDLYPTFVAKYSFLVGFEEDVWAETVAATIAEGDTELRSLRGKIVERFIPGMKEMRELYARLGKLAESKGWKILEPISGARTPDGNEIADWMIVAEHKDGRIWVMALIESKSISNTRDLVSHKGRGVGQHLWDWIRLKTEGLVLTKEGGEAVKYLPEKIEGAPVPLGAPPPSHGLTTDLIGVTPRDFTKGELKKLAGLGVDIKRWPWPVDQDEFAKMLQELRNALGLLSSGD
jgi:hypothetical protein